MKARHVIIGFMLCITSLYAQQSVKEVWVRQYLPPVPQKAAMAEALAIDAVGNVYVAGTSINANTSSDFVILKYDQDGNQQWVARFNGPANKDDDVEALAVDASGNVYVTGASEGAGEFTDFVTIKYNSSGAQEWLARYNGPGNLEDDGQAIAVDAFGNVYVTGLSMNPGIVSTLDFVTIKYNAKGEQQWVARYNGPAGGDDVGNAIAVDAVGNVYVTGMSQTSPTQKTLHDFATVKYDANGKELWVARYNGPAGLDDFALAIAIDPAGHVVVTGVSIGAGTLSDVVTAKYNSDGKELWANRYNGNQNVDDIPSAIGIDGAGNVYVTGTANGTRFSKSSDYVTIKYSSSGVEEWVTLYDGPGKAWEMAKALAVDNAGNAYVTGQSVGPDSTGADYATVKYNSAGVVQWIARYNSKDKKSDGAEGIAVDQVGNVYVTGTSNLDADMAAMVTIKYAQTTAITSPVLVSPVNGATNQPTTLTLRWNAFAGAVSYRLQVSTDPLFGTLVLDDPAITDTSRVVSALANNTTFYWRVNAKKASGEVTEYSEIWKFTTIVATPGIPILASPPNGATNQPTVLTLRWRPVQLASTYRLQLSTDATFATLAFDDSTLTDTLRVVGPLTTTTKYYWRVNAKNLGGTSAWSEVWNFTTTTVVAPEFVIAGKVSYCPTNGAVQNVNMALSGGVSGRQLTDANGEYLFDKLPGGLNYTVTPSKTDDIGASSISFYDAALIARIVLGMIKANHCDSLAADVDENGKITFFDAVLTGRFALGLPPYVPFGHVGEWRFRPAHRSYTALDSDRKGQDYVATLLGDVDGNWKPAGASAAREVAVVEKYPYLTDLIAQPGEVVRLPLMIEESSAVLAADVDFAYDPQVLRFIEISKTTLSENFEVMVNPEAGRLRLGAYSANPVMKSGEFLGLRFEVIGKAEARSPLTLNRFQLNGGAVQLAHAELFVGAASSEVPKHFVLGQNYPNPYGRIPFYPETSITFGIPPGAKEKVNVRLAVYNTFGQLVRVLVDEEKAAGFYTVQWDGRNDAGRTVPSGVYFYTLVSGDFKATKKVLVIR